MVDVGAPDVPEPWASRLIARGFTDRRGAGNRPSLTALAEHCGVHASTISAAIHGGSRKTSAETAGRLADALGGDVLAWLGLPRLKEWRPPPNAAMMNDRQRRAVEELINAMTDQPTSASAATVQDLPRAARPGTPELIDDDWEPR